jgi:hypothetical protein
LRLPDGGVDRLQDRDGKRRSLARAGLGLSDNVTALEYLRLKHCVRELQYNLTQKELATGYCFNDMLSFEGK